MQFPPPENRGCLMPGDLASMKWRMFRVLSITLTCLLFTGLAGEGRGEELTEAQKKALFLRAREDIRPVPHQLRVPKPLPSPNPPPTNLRNPRKMILFLWKKSANRNRSPEKQNRFPRRSQHPRPLPRQHARQPPSPGGEMHAAHRSPLKNRVPPENRVLRLPPVRAGGSSATDILHPRCAGRLTEPESGRGGGGILLSTTVPPIRAMPKSSTAITAMSEKCPTGLRIIL